jgi:hypothetical protein
MLCHRRNFVQIARKLSCRRDPATQLWFKVAKCVPFVVVTGILTGEKVSIIFFKTLIKYTFIQISLCRIKNVQVKSVENYNRITRKMKINRTLNVRLTVLKRIRLFASWAVTG